MIARGKPLLAMGALLFGGGLWLGMRLPVLAAEAGQFSRQLASAGPAAPAASAAMAAAQPASAPVPAAPSPAPQGGFSTVLLWMPPAYWAAFAPALPAAAPAAVPARQWAEALSPPPAAAAPALANGPAPVAAPAAVAATAGQPSPAYQLADAAYARLRAGQRQQAAALFDAALAIEPGNSQWQADRKALGKRWQLGGYSLLREAGEAGPAASPVLGGGQVGGSLAWIANPSARRPTALVARMNVAADSQGVRPESFQAAFGVRQTLLPGVSLSVERLVPIGRAAQVMKGDVTARLAAGGQWQRLTAYGEAGVLGRGQIYAGGQAGWRVMSLGPATLSAGSWASIQTGPPDLWRVDVGPSLSTTWHGLRLQADWRERVAGNAQPGSGPAVTVSAGF